MSSFSVKTKLHGHTSQRRSISGRVDVTRVPVQHGVAVFEGSRLSHKHFAAAAFFRGASIKPNGTFDRSSVDLLGNRDRC